MLYLLLSALALASPAKPLPKSESSQCGLITVVSKKRRFVVSPPAKLLNKYNLNFKADGMEVSKIGWGSKKIEYCLTKADASAVFLLSRKKFPAVGKRSYCAFQLDSATEFVGQKAYTKTDLNGIKADGLTCSVAKAAPPKGYKEAFVITVA
jgi:hypothetical protein